MSVNHYAEQLERQIKFERIISDIARRFVHMENVETSINYALKVIGEFSLASRAYIFEFHEDCIRMDNTYEWCAEGVTPEIEMLKNQEIAMFSWWMAQIQEGKILDINDVESLGPEARNEKDILMLQGIKSVLVLPIIIQNRLSGFVGFDNVHAKSNWTESDRVILGIAAEFFSNIFNRKRYEKHIATSNKELNDALLNLKIAQNQLIQQEQMAAVGQLAAGIAHEINNPLTFVLSNHQMLTLYLKELIEMIDSQPACNLDDEQKSHYDFLKNDIMDVFEDMNLGIERVTKIVEGLKSFSRMDQSDVFDAYDLNDNIKHTLTIINSRIKSAATLTLDLEEDLPIIYANGSKINQVILNIIVNAIDAIEEKNSIESGALEICTKLVHDEVALIISDNGIGMSPETIQKLFNPFYTTKPIGKGTGLGMSITHEIIKNLHHGRIEVASQRQLGTTISIFLPLTHSHNNIL